MPDTKKRIELAPCPFCGGDAAVAPSKLNQLWWAYCSGDDCDIYPESRFHDTKEQAIKAWNTRANEWISCEDRLPEDGQWVLAYTNERNDGYFVATLQGNFWVENGTGCGCCCGSPSITHWQPLPEPPEHFVDANKKVGGDD